MDFGNKLKDTLRQGGVAIGAFTTLASPEVVEILALGGMDFVLFDAEHGPLSPESVYPLILAAEAHNLPTLVRIGQNERQVILKFLDLGIGGVLIPQTNTAADAKRAVDAMRYSPRGIRGLAGVRSFHWGMEKPVAELVDAINERTLTMVQFEHIDTLQELDQILELPELDMLFVGPNDLAISMGFPGQPGHPEVQAVIEQVIARTKECGKWLGTVAPDPDNANRQIERGFQLVAANVPGLLIQGLKAYMSGVKRP